jgi:hypothetical protein
MSREDWKPVPGWPGYEVSNFGQVRSVARTRLRRNGVWLTIPAQVLRQSRSRSRYRYASVTLADGQRRRSFYVHRLVAALFGEQTAGDYSRDSDCYCAGIELER